MWSFLPFFKKNRVLDSFQGRRTLLHVSDTPSTLVPFLRRIIERLRPVYIVHTGDFVDDVKLELRPQSHDLFERRFPKLVAVLEASRARMILALGNHDDPGAVLAFAPFADIIGYAGATLEIAGRRFRIAHKPGAILQDPGEFNLYGHDMELPSGVRNDRVYLNGIEHVNIIDFDAWVVRTIRYPFGTDDARLLRRRARL